MTPAKTHGTNCVLGAAVGYRWDQIAPFVISCRRACPHDDIVLLVGRLDHACRVELARYGVRTVAAGRSLDWLPPRVSRQRYNRLRLGWLLRSLPRTLASLPGSTADPVWLARVCTFFHHPACSRYFYYYRYLRRRAMHYAQVLVTDVRDVVLQTSPFIASADPTPQVFLEYGARHGENPGNDMWVDVGFGAEGRAQLAGRRVTCSGTTLAPASAMLEYLRLMTQEIALRTHRFAGLDGVDQGVHNWLFWTGQLPEFRAAQNFTGPVLTMHGMPTEQIPILNDGRITDPAGTVVPVLHQYDRHPALAPRILARIVP